MGDKVDKFIKVKSMKDILNKLDDEMLLVVNDLGNVAVLDSSRNYKGFICFMWKELCMYGDEQTCKIGYTSLQKRN